MQSTKWFTWLASTVCSCGNGPLPRHCLTEGQRLERAFWSGFPELGLGVLQYTVQRACQHRMQKEGGQRVVKGVTRSRSCEGVPSFRFCSLLVHTEIFQSVYSGL